MSAHDRRELMAALAAVVHWFKVNCYRVVYPHTRLYHDLQLWGIELDAFLIDFTEHFGLDPYEMPFDRFFVEVMGLEYWYYKWFRPEVFIREPLTIWDLSGWVATGVLRS